METTTTHPPTKKAPEAAETEATAQAAKETPPEEAAAKAAEAAEAATGATTEAAKETPPEDAAAKAEAGASEGATPAWLTAAFLREALASRAEGDGAALRVRGFRAESAVGKGDNYASVLLRVRVHVEQEGAGSEAEQRSIVVKSVPTEAMTRMFVERGQLFPKERRMYSETLPRMHQLLRTRLGSQPFGSLAATAYDSSLPEVLVFDDLCAHGFKMANRQSGMDIDHCLLVMRALGTFHALSIVMHEEDPTCLEYPESFYTEEAMKEYEMWMPTVFESLAKNVETWEGFGNFADKLRVFGKDIMPVTIKLMAETENRFKVLNHGDCWVNNMLFKYSETTEQPTEIRLLDFQICRHTSMAFDLLYFLFSSPKPDIRIEKLEEMLSGYYATLAQVLRELDCEHRLVTWEELQGEVKRTMPFALMTATNLMPIIVADPSEAMDMEGLTEENLLAGANPLEKALAGRTFAKALRPLLPYFEQEGLL